MKRTWIAAWMVLGLMLTGPAPAQQQDRQLEQALDAKLGAMSRVSPDLVALYRQNEAVRAAAAFGPPAAEPPVQAGSGPLRAADPITILAADRVVIDAAAENDTGALVAELEAIGFEVTGIWGRVVSGHLPIDAIGDLAGAANLRFARAAASRNNIGLVTSQGVAAMNADVVQAIFGIDGSGTTVGTLSDSFDCLGGAAGDVAAGDLPSGIIVLNDGACAATDEGRAMMQLIRDVAPGAGQAFHTAFLGQASFANGIVDLANVAGADVIVDDVIYFAEPMFQDGIIAQAVDQVKSAGSAYFSSAGNQGRDAWEDSYRSSGVAGVFGGIRHDFDPGPGVDDLQGFMLGSGLTIFTFQWDQPFFSVSGAPGSASDMDIVLYLPPGIFIGLGGFAFNIGGDAVEVFGVVNGGPPLLVELGLELFSGPPPGSMKYVFFGNSTVSQFATNSGTTYGHANAIGAEAVGASAYFNAVPFVNPPIINGFSSAGGTPILFDINGNPTFDLRPKPEIVGPDGTNTTFFGFDFEPDGFPNFFGTSASAPHAAAVAALIIDTKPSIGPTTIYSILEQTAIDMDDPFTPGFDFGFDFGTGFGFINAQDAVLEAARDGKKIFVCHKGKNTLSIAPAALTAHLQHGDSLGLCD